MSGLVGWRFDNLGLGFDAGSGLTTTPAGGIATVTGDDTVRQAIVMLLATRPGERVMRKDYGCPLHRLVFCPNDATAAGLAIHYVRQALLRWEPRIDILRLDAGSGEAQGNSLYVWLDYRVRQTQNRDSVVFSIDLAGEAADANTATETR